MNQSSIHLDAEASRIFVVDDLADNSFLLQIILEEEGYQVEVTDNGYAALKMVEANPPDLILLDVMMPGINGFEVTQRIRQNSRLPFIPILLITAHDLLDESQALYIGANGLLHKPINPDLLLKQVETMLQEKSLRFV